MRPTREAEDAAAELARLQANRAKCPRAVAFLELIEPKVFEASEPPANLRVLHILIDGRVRIGVDLTAEEAFEVEKALILWGIVGPGICAFCDEPLAGPPLLIQEEADAKGDKAARYCSVRCCENAIEAGGMAEAARALR